jgi:small-conductance mechanosensitive channel
MKGNGGGRSGREESPEERADRRWTELLQEVRVAQTGVQILFGFLLTVVFQPRFADLPQADRVIYLTTVFLGAAATGSLIAPVALHRMLTGRRVKPQTVEWAARLTVTGLVLLLCTMAAALLLILRVVLDNTLALWLVTPLVLWFVLCWFVLPLWARMRSEAGGADTGTRAEDEAVETRPDRLNSVNLRKQ